MKKTEQTNPETEREKVAPGSGGNNDPWPGDAAKKPGTEVKGDRGEVTEIPVVQ